MYTVKIKGCWNYFDTFEEVINFIRTKYEEETKASRTYYTQTYKDEWDDDDYYYSNNYEYSGIQLGSTEKELKNNLNVLSLAYKTAEKLDKDPVKFAFNNKLAAKLEGISRADLFIFIEQLEEAIKDIRERKERLKTFQSRLDKMTTLEEVETFLKDWGGTGFDKKKNKSFVRYRIEELKTAKQLKAFIDYRTDIAYSSGYADGYDDY